MKYLHIEQRENSQEFYDGSVLLFTAPLGKPVTIEFNEVGKPIAVICTLEVDQIQVQLLVNERPTRIFASTKSALNWLDNIWLR